MKMKLPIGLQNLLVLRTGSKFFKVSLLSGLNNLKDVTRAELGV